MGSNVTSDTDVCADFTCPGKLICNLIAEGWRKEGRKDGRKEGRKCFI